MCYKIDFNKLIHYLLYYMLLLLKETLSLKKNKKVEKQFELFTNFIV